MHSTLEIIAVWIGAAAINTALLAVIARPLANFVHRLVYPAQKSARS